MKPLKNLLHIAPVRRTFVRDFMLLNLNYDIHCSFYIADQDTAQYNLCSAGENCGSWAELLKCTTDNLFSSHVFLLNLLLKYKFTSKTGSFKSYDSHQLLCGGMVEGNSELFCIAWFCRRLYIHPGLFGGLKIVQFDWLLLKLINYSYGYKPIRVPHFGQLDVSWYPMKI